MTRAANITPGTLVEVPKPGPYDMGGEFGPEPKNVTPAEVAAPETPALPEGKSDEAPAEPVAPQPPRESLALQVANLTTRESARELHVHAMEQEMVVLRAELRALREFVGGPEVTA